MRLPRFPVLIFPQATAGPAALIVRLGFDVADCAVGLVESFTVTATVLVPTELLAGTPVMAPVALLIANPLGRLVAA